MEIAPDFSVIIPARNMELTLTACLSAVFASSARPAEVIVVDDASEDRTAEIASSFGCRVIPADLCSGPMEPRFAGARSARTPVLVFVDADVRVRPDTFARILGRFEDPSIHAVTGILSAGHSAGSFFADYKNHYMRHVFLRQPSESHFLYGSLWAVRREDMIFFRPIRRPFGSLVSDSEAGMRLRRRGKRVVLDHALEVDHLKRYTFLGLLKNDFVIPFLFSLMLVRYGGLRNLFSRSRFSHASAGQALAMTAAPCAVISALLFCFFRQPAFFWASAALFIFFYIYWLPFIAGMRGRGAGFRVSAALFKPLDAAVMFSGMTAGFFYSLSGFFRRKGFIFR